MKYYVLASGSQGNSTFIDFDGVGVLIDCGISKKQLIYRMSLHGYDIKDIKIGLEIMWGRWKWKRVKIYQRILQ